MKTGKILILCAILAFGSVNMANAQGLGDILNGIGNALGGNGSGSSNGNGSALGNLLEGVFSSSKIEVKDMAGSWVSDGPAVCFQGDNFLKKAGGVAAAAAIETKLNPYYKKYGLTGATIDITKEGEFLIKIKGISLKGTITKESGDGDGIFTFTFKAFGSISLGSFKTYVQKTSRSLDVMFDATKFKNIVSGIAKFTGIKLASTLSGILDSYDGLCVGFHLSKTGNAVDEEEETATGVGNAITDGLGKLFGTGTGTGNGNNSTTTAEPDSTETDTPSNSGSNALGTLFNVLNNGNNNKKKK